MLRQNNCALHRFQAAPSALENLSVSLCAVVFRERLGRGQSVDHKNHPGGQPGSRNGIEWEWRRGRIALKRRFRDGAVHRP